jgi:hypothetical protein
MSLLSQACAAVLSGTPSRQEHDERNCPLGQEPPPRRPQVQNFLAESIQPGLAALASPAMGAAASSSDAGGLLSLPDHAGSARRALKGSRSLPSLKGGSGQGDAFSCRPELRPPESSLLSPTFSERPRAASHFDMGAEPASPARPWTSSVTTTTNMWELRDTVARDQPSHHSRPGTSPSSPSSGLLGSRRERLTGSCVDLGVPPLAGAGVPAWGIADSLACGSPARSIQGSRRGGRGGLGSRAGSVSSLGGRGSSNASTRNSSLASTRTASVASTRERTALHLELPEATVLPSFEDHKQPQSPTADARKLLFSAISLSRPGTSSSSLDPSADARSNLMAMIGGPVAEEADAPSSSSSAQPRGAPQTRTRNDSSSAMGSAAELDVLEDMVPARLENKGRGAGTGKEVRQQPSTDSTTSSVVQSRRSSNCSESSVGTWSSQPGLGPGPERSTDPISQRGGEPPSRPKDCDRHRGRLPAKLPPLSKRPGTGSESPMHAPAPGESQLDAWGPFEPSHSSEPGNALASSSSGGTLGSTSDSLKLDTLGPAGLLGAPEPHVSLPGGRRQGSRSSGKHSKNSKDWQISLCQSVAMRCPTSLPTKDVFAQRKVPRPVSPSRDGGSVPATTDACEKDPNNSEQLLSLGANVSDLLAGIATKGKQGEAVSEADSELSPCPPEVEDC